MVRTKVYEAMGGEHISRAAERAVVMVNVMLLNLLATRHPKHRRLKARGASGVMVVLPFNGIDLSVSAWNTAAEVSDRYTAESTARHEAYIASPEYKRQQAEYEAKEAAKKLLLEGALSVAGPLELSDSDGWQEFKEKNSHDAYSKAVVDYAETWGRLMQTRIVNGESMADCAAELSHVANTEGITGFMYGCAVHSLAQFWKHGEALRKWHNTEYGRPDATGTINPAVLTVGRD